MTSVASDSKSSREWSIRCADAARPREPCGDGMDRWGTVVRPRSVSETERGGGLPRGAGARTHGSTARRGRAARGLHPGRARAGARLACASGRNSRRWSPPRPRAHHADTARGAAGREDVDGALEAVEGVRPYRRTPRRSRIRVPQERVHAGRTARSCADRRRDGAPMRTRAAPTMVLRASGNGRSGVGRRGHQHPQAAGHAAHGDGGVARVFAVDHHPVEGSSSISTRTSRA